MSRTFAPLPPITYLDMDGVCVAWTEAVCALYGVPVPEGPMTYDLHPYFGVSEDAMWARINALGTDWWAALPPYPWFRNLFSALAAIGPRVVFLTSPCTEGHSAAGKVRWIRKHVAPDFRDYVITSKKYLLARPGTVLVDDSDDKLAAFSNHGGNSVVFPRQWNTGGTVHGDLIVDHVVAEVRSAFLRDKVAL